VESSTASPLNFLAGSQEDAFFLSRSDSIDEAPELSPELSAAFKLRGVRTIGDLERVSGADLSEWSEIDLSASQLRYHQSVCLLLCDVRNLRPYDVRILVGAGVDSADQLKSTPSHELLERVEQFIQTTEGRAILVSGDDVELARVANWIRSARESRAFGRRSNRSPQSKQPPQSKPQGLRIASTNERRAEKTTPRGRGAAAKRRSSPSPAPQPSRRSTSSGSGNRKFYLERSSDVEAAPSIGPKMAEHLGKVKVVTVGDLLDDDANTIAERLRQRRVNGETVRQWQSQAEWMCRVPGLRGHDAQILVACGYDSVEQLHGVEPAELFAVVQPVVESKDGRRILRGGKKPDLAEVTDWLQWVQNSRQLQAA
jgi:hypothetical protein